MKNASTNRKPTASAPARIATKKTKQKSGATPKLDKTTRKTKVASKTSATSNRGTTVKKTLSATVRTSKKALNQRKGVGKGIEHTKVTSSPSDRFVPRTPERKVRSSSAHSTPSTAASTLSSSSKCAASMMNKLALKSPRKNSKNTRDKHRTVDFNDVLEIDWLSVSEIDDALVHHGEELSELSKLDYHQKIVCLCTYFKPNDIRPVFQGICQDAGMNWRHLKLAKHKSMKSLSADFAMACVDILNARVDLNVPGKIAVKNETRDEMSKA